MKPTVYILLRLGAGVSMLGHGLVRLPKLKLFSAWMSGAFKDSMLPHPLIAVFSYMLPLAEFTIGALLLTGLFTRKALLSAGVVMLLLILGTCLIENWEAIPSQLIHLIFFGVLLQYINSNSYAVDNLLHTKE
ncbi:DoxX family membrane protein [Flavobacterium sp. ST-75]|uniref:DoxX family membrane protein n=1 Tax=Flavobacterium rhizophilum TaxID=3163296 RepID=A0ABW8Y9M2_9FLAO